jgi:hypothetical protein
MTISDLLNGGSSDDFESGLTESNDGWLPRLIDIVVGVIVGLVVVIGIVIILVLQRQAEYSYSYNDTSGANLPTHTPLFPDTSCADLCHS